MAKKLAQQLEKTYNKYKVLTGIPTYDLFLERMDTAALTFNVVHSNSVKTKAKVRAMKNFTINLVSAIEIYCKELIIDKHGKWNDEGLRILLDEKDKVKLSELFEIFKIGEVKKEHIILEFHLFENIHVINKVFSLLTGEYKNNGTGNGAFQFLDNLQRLKINDTNTALADTILKEMPDWWANFNTLFEARHQIVHEDETDFTIDNTSVSKMESAGFLFIWSMYLRFKN